MDAGDDVTIGVPAATATASAPTPAPAIAVPVPASRAVGSTGFPTVVVGSGIAYVAIQTTVVHVPPPEPAFHVAHAHDDLVVGGAEVALVLATLVVGGRRALQHGFQIHVRPGDIV